MNKFNTDEIITNDANLIQSFADLNGLKQADARTVIVEAKGAYVTDSEGNKLIDGIKKISRAVKSTLGPRGNTVLIESQEHLHGITVTKDGVTVAKSISLLDPIENLSLIHI